MDWKPAQKPAGLAESRLISAILDGIFPIDSYLPAERELAEQIGVTRPTLREALQRLTRDGWIEIHHGRPTRVRNYWEEGNLGVLGAIAGHAGPIQSHFVGDLLSVRLVMAPAYTRLAVDRSPEPVTDCLVQLSTLEDTPSAFTSADWRLHHLLTVASGNPIYTLILNGFRDLYQEAGEVYFTPVEARYLSRSFYTELLAATHLRDAQRAEEITSRVMMASLEMWHSRHLP
ncbi:MAG TPA: fatty acid metabolism transcriptional regulator FadR [Anaerolineaceae bacterium]|nr:fatty acid metabolism transcriptional regulator FadR [Anaerolineaceae bacterium]